MKYNMELLKADVLDELEKIDRIVNEYMKAKDRIKLPPEDVSYYDRGAIGYILHNFYNGCENIFRSIAMFFENDLEPQSWHRDLLKRMKIEIHGFRPQVVGEDLYAILDDLRAFRHKFRHSYGFELDWEKECLVAKKLPKAAEMLKAEIHVFLKTLEQI